MRQAHFDVNWVRDCDGAPIGFSLGYDFCPDHEHGFDYLTSALGIPQCAFPLGLEDRTLTHIPKSLGFRAYDWRPAKGPCDAPIPAAMLWCTSRFDYEPTPDDLEVLLDHLPSAAAFAHPPETDGDADNLHSCWSGRGGFIIHVRGEHNVRHLQALHEAMLALRVSLITMSFQGFKRTAFTLVMNDRLPASMKADILAQDQAALDLHTAATSTHIKERLAAAGLHWYALSPRWRNGPDSELLFFLNPQSQKEFDFGWFTLAELEAWAEGHGPIIDGLSARKSVEARVRDFSYQLVKGLGAHKATLASDCAYVWLDRATNRPGIRLLVAEPGLTDLKDGIYDLTDLWPYLKLQGDIPAAV